MCVCVPRYEHAIPWQCLLHRLQPCHHNPQPVTCNPQPATCNPQPATRNLQPTTCNPQPATRNLQPATRNPQPATAVFLTRCVFTRHQVGTSPFQAHIAVMSSATCTHSIYSFMSTRILKLLAYIHTSTKLGSTPRFPR